MTGLFWAMILLGYEKRRDMKPFLLQEKGFVSASSIIYLNLRLAARWGAWWPLRSLAAR